MNHPDELLKLMQNPVYFDVWTKAMRKARHIPHTIWIDPTPRDYGKTAPVRLIWDLNRVQPRHPYRSADPAFLPSHLRERAYPSRLTVVAIAWGTDPQAALQQYLSQVPKLAPFAPHVVHEEPKPTEDLRGKLKEIFDEE